MPEEPAGRAVPVLEVTDLEKSFPAPRQAFAMYRKRFRAVDGVSFHIDRGETLGLVGESGSGKSTVGRCVLRLIEPTAGSVRVQGVDILSLSGRRLRAMRQHMHMIFQDPHSSLNPRMRVGRILQGPLLYHGSRDRTANAELVTAILAKIGLRPELADRYPHGLSGGQRQRVAIARALIAGSSLVVADEPISALDASIQASIINLLKDLQRDLGFSCLFITHDLSAAEVTCDRLAVMYLGQLVEIGTRAEIVGSPKHPYTQALISAVLIPDPVGQRARRQIILAGELPSQMDPPSGCRFRTRCPVAISRCANEEPALRKAGMSGRLVRCHLVGADGTGPDLAGG
jgi:oligopeptide transport system ATP-binding protein